MNDQINPSDYDIDDGTMDDAAAFVGTEEDNTVYGEDPIADEEAETAKPSDYFDPEEDDPENGIGDNAGDAGGDNGEENDAAKVIEEDDADFSPEFVQRALAVGVSESTLKRLGDEAMSFVQRLENAGTQSATGPQRDSQGRFKSADEQSGDDKDPLEGLTEEEGYDPKLVQAIRSSFERNKQLELQIEQLLSQSRAAEQTRIINDLDQFVDGLGKEWNDVFGTGNTQSLNPKSRAMKNRQTLLEEMDAIADGYAQRGRQIPSESELREKALRSAFGKDLEKKSQRKLSTQSQQQRQTRVTRVPQSKRTTGKTGVNKAVGTVQSMLNNGIR